MPIDATGPDLAEDGQHLEWRPDRTVLVSADDAEVWMFGGDGPVRLAGRGAGPLARAVSEGGDEAAILVRAQDGGMSRDRSQELLGKWRSSGHVVPIAPTEPARALRVIDATEGGDDAAHLTAALASLGITTDGGPDAPLVVVVSHPLALGAAVARVSEPHVGMSMRGPRAYVSPLLGTGRPGRCAACLDARLRHRMAAEIVGARRVGREVPPAHPLLHPSAVAACAAAVAQILSTASDREDVTVYDVAAGTMQRYPVVPVPGCPACDPGGATARMAHLDGPVGLTGSAYDEGGGGGFRTLDPEDTWDDHAHLVNDVVGLVPYVVSGPMRELRSYSSGLNAAAIDDPVAFTSRLRSGAGGKGITRSGARAGALAEALERGSMRARGDEPSRVARMADLEGAIHPNDVELFSEAQLRRSEGLAAFGLAHVPDESGHRPVPLPFDVDAEHHWSSVAELRTGNVRWLPSSTVWFDWPGLAPGAYRANSNGAAAGNTLDEALLQGLLELVERDSVALWWHPMCRRPAFDLDAWDDPRIAAALAPQRALGTEAWVLDVTSDLGIPAAVAVAHGLGHTRAPLLGFGAHIDPAVAVVRALTELAQMQTAFVGGCDDLINSAGPGERRWFSQVTVESEPWLAPHGTVSPPSVSKLDSIGAAVDHVATRLENAGMTVMWADCSRPDVPMSIVKTFAPGMRHFWNRYAPGRLYDVPPRLGWQSGGPAQPGGSAGRTAGSYGEPDLNPWAMIL